VTERSLTKPQEAIGTEPSELVTIKHHEAANQETVKVKRKTLRDKHNSWQKASYRQTHIGGQQARSSQREKEDLERQTQLLAESLL
jgi:hypothetical protein